MNCRVGLVQRSRPLPVCSVSSRKTALSGVFAIAEIGALLIFPPTQKGRSLKNELLHMAIKINEIATSSLSAEEVETLKRLMRVMKTNLDQDEENTTT